MRRSGKLRGYAVYLVAASVFLAAFTGSVLAGESIWTHNGSTLRWVSDGNTRSAFYLEPRADLAGTGIKAGQLLFQGERKSGQIEGTAYTFKRGCPPAAFDVSGTVTDENEIVLQGMQPVRANGCETTSTRSVTLTFDYQRTAGGNETASNTGIDPSATAKPESHLGNNDDGTTIVDILNTDPVKDEARRLAENLQAQRTMNASGVTRFLKWTQADAFTEREALYDTCSDTWNKRRFFSLYNPKYLVAASNHLADGSYSTTCFINSNSSEAMPDIAFDIMKSDILRKCAQSYKNCYMFASSNNISEWALSEERRIADNSRFARTARSNANTGGDGNGQGSGLGSTVKNLTNILEGIEEGVDAVNGSGLGNSARAGGGSSIPSGSGYSQRGAFDDCAQVFAAGGDQKGAEECRRRANNMGSIR